MSIEDNSRAKSEKQHFESSLKVDELVDIRDAEGYDDCHLNRKIVTGKNTQGNGGGIRPEIRRRRFVEEMRKKNTSKLPCSYAIGRGPLTDIIGMFGRSIRPKIGRKIERWIKGLESTTGPEIPFEMGLYRRPKRNGGKREKKSSALSDGKKKKKVAAKPKTSKV